MPNINTLKVKGSENPVKEEVITSNNQKEDEVKMKKAKTHVICYTPKDAKKGDDHQLRIGGDSFEGLILPAAKIDIGNNPRVRQRRNRKSVFLSLGKLCQPCKSVFERLGPIRKKAPVFDRSKIDQMLKEFEVESVEKVHHEIYETTPKGVVKIDNYPQELEESVGSTFPLTTSDNETIEGDMTDAPLELEEGDGPYVIREVYTNGSYLMVDQDGVKVGLINGRYLKLYYP
ncbi:hypothetical protein LIER_14667 [Lithospermum erythrorhizon]|uniref:Uncharacterized protein n=1 Tax=Lithospermum erythrorhizon TaxID=34254 RepID=A0AAV3Q1X9_LITER